MKNTNLLFSLTIPNPNNLLFLMLGRVSKTFRGGGRGTVKSVFSQTLKYLQAFKFYLQTTFVNLCIFKILKTQIFKIHRF